MTIGVLTAAGAGAGSFGVLIGVVAQRVPAHKRSVRLRIRQCRRQPGPVRVRAAQPVADLQHHLDGRDVDAWRSRRSPPIPLARLLTRDPHAASPAGSRACSPARSACASNCAIAARDKSYWCLHAGFFTCGFHIAFLVTHLPGEVKLCSLPASGGSELVVHHRSRQCRRQPVGGLGRRRVPHEVPAVRDVLLARRGHRHLPGGTQDDADLLSIRRGAGVHLAGNRAAHGRSHRQVVRRAVSRHVVRPRDASRTRSAPSSAPGWAASRWCASATTRGCGTRTSRWRCWPRS